VPQVREYEAPDIEQLPAFPEAPERFSGLEPSALKALENAAHTAAQEGLRIALQKLQLRGDKGELVGTAGRQLLFYAGMAFPWKGDVLVPPVGCLACRELPPDAPIALGKTDTHVCIRVGAWTFFLAIDTESRFPKVEESIPGLAGKITTWRLSPPDAAFLAKVLPRLPGGADDSAPLTLDLDGEITVRARAEGQGRQTEVVLNRSEVVGPAVRLVTNRKYLARALQLGFGEFSHRPNYPASANGRRQQGHSPSCPWIRAENAVGCGMVMIALNASGARWA
jgi:hypothetical protein